MRPLRRRALVLAAAGTLTAGFVASCSSDSSSTPPDTTVATGGAPVDAEVLVDWTGLIGEVLVACNDATGGADGLLDTHSATQGGEDVNVAAALAAGQAVEHCAHALDGEEDLTSRAQLEAAWPEGTTLVGEWLVAMGDANRSAVVVSAGNVDSRVLVGELHENQHRADDLAGQIDLLFTDTATSLGLEAPDGLGLYRWSPPEH
jgi:hypothetical protein